ncbi:unnamed protein product [Choristocarpus tenellus]
MLRLKSQRLYLSECVSDRDDQNANADRPLDIPTNMTLICVHQEQIAPGIENISSGAWSNDPIFCLCLPFVAAFLVAYVLFYVEVTFTLSSVLYLLDGVHVNTNLPLGADSLPPPLPRVHPSRRSFFLPILSITL